MSIPKNLMCRVLAVLVALGVPAVASADSEEPRPKTPIEHFIFLMQENHSFDNYFGTYPGADGTPEDTCMPVDPDDSSNPQCVEPFRLGDQAVRDLGHNDKIFNGSYSDGRMDGFVSVHGQRGTDGSLAMGYYDGDDLPFYWNLADEYVLFDRFFTSAAGGSVWNHMYWVTGTPGNPEFDAIPEDGFGDLPTIFDRLQERGISWKFYVQNYNPGITYRSRGLGDKGSQVVWVPLLNYARYLDDPELFSHIVPLDEYFKDLENGTLPSVAYMVPSGASEHPPGSIRAGQRFVRTLINALMRSDAWSNSAFMWSYDDWGGWFDHVPPPQVDEFGYGFRAPALLVSSYARQGHIDSTELDFTSALKFIEENWDLEPLADRDANANSFMGAFDFSRPPREPAFLAAERGADGRSEPTRAIIYGAYAIALVVPALIMGGVAISAGSSRLRGRRSTRPLTGEEGQPW